MVTQYSGYGYQGRINRWQDWINLALAVWLFAFSALTDRADPRTFWNNAMVAVLVFILSMLGPKRDWFTPPSRPSSARG